MSTFTDEDYASRETLHLIISDWDTVILKFFNFREHLGVLCNLVLWQGNEIAIGLAADDEDVAEKWGIPAKGIPLV